MELTNNNTQADKVEKTEAKDSAPDVTVPTPTVEQKTTTNNASELNKLNFNNKNVTPHILLDHFKGMLSSDKIVFYDKRGGKFEFDNMGVTSRRYVKVDDRNGSRNKFVVSMKTYLHLMGDVVVMEWDNSEVKYTTKLNHIDLQNWSGKMYWKGTYSQVQGQLQAQAKVENKTQLEISAQVPTVPAVQAKTETETKETETKETESQEKPQAVVESGPL